MKNTAMKKVKNRGNFRGKKGTKISYNSSASNNREDTKKLKSTINSKVIQLLEDNTARSSRIVSNELNIERTSITRALNTLMNRNIVYIAFDAKCPYTARKVGYYRLKRDEKGGQLSLIDVPESPKPKDTEFLKDW